MNVFSPEEFTAAYRACALIPEPFRTEDCARKCTGIAACLLEDNAKFNLTAITEPEEILCKHILDSLICAYKLSELAADLGSPRLIDIGSGAGFPALPIAAALPQFCVTAMDSTAKKCTHISDTAARLGIRGVRAIPARAEAAAREKMHREQYDFVTARAVANLPVLAELCLPMIRPGGFFVAMKGKSAADELAAADGGIRKLGAIPHETRKYTVPGDPNPRYLLIIRKISPTPAEYPRQYAQITKNPL